MVKKADEISLPIYAAGDIEVPFVISGMNQPLERDTFWPEHSHPTHELLWNERGISTATIGARTWTITPRHGLWIPAGTLHAGRARSGTWYRAAQFGINHTPALAETPVAVDITPLLRLVLERLDAPELSQSSRALSESMVIDLLEPSPHELLVHIPQAPVLRPIVEAVIADPSDPRTLSEWAISTGVSTRTLTRAFQAEIGLGFSAWVATVRSQAALRLLADGAPIEDVAEAAGYGSVSAFGAAFRRVTGLTPAMARTA